MLRWHVYRALAEATSRAARSALATVLGAVLAATGALATPTPGALAAPPPAPRPSAIASALATFAAPASAAPEVLAAPSVSPASASAASAASVQGPASAPSAAPIRFTSPDDLGSLPPLPTEFPPLPELRLPKYTTATLRNGLRVFLLPDDEVPLVRATLLMRGGQYGSPADKVGTASLTSYVQRAGGSAQHPAPGLDERLEQLAASIELGAGPQATSADMQCLVEDVEEVMALFAEVASVLLAEPGVTLADPDTFALDVLGGVFNSFGGTLFDTLRSREGLAYSVSGAWDSPPDHPGLFVAGGQTSAPGDFLRSLRALLAAAAAEPPPAAELEAAKSETLNSFAFNFASNANQLQRILVYDLLGLPQDYLFRYFKGIEQVTRADVGRAAAAHLHPAFQAIVVVADREAAEPNLEAAGFRVLPMRLEDAA
ncbi:hypothetical protein TSOC_010067 [Tetrabaena socialis]|uniref:Peptidase M16 C-terminal domain-containing protein n=1 Tax=Tetrabaena socialis TaxID=47790 RepID=A0A2J7ZUC8_9CHLO|nr:hypothetical protein TSOC_010067 [Tetrabaena socialis]|eukprot:PNH03840.1 hypothetical protein TSOC_010067 [Tetrabaena socialis]